MHCEKLNETENDKLTNHCIFGTRRTCKLRNADCSIASFIEYLENIQVDPKS